MFGKLLILLAITGSIFIYFQNYYGFQLPSFQTMIQNTKDKILSYTSSSSYLEETFSSEFDKNFYDSFLGNIKGAPSKYQKHGQEPSYSCYYQKYCMYESGDPVDTNIGDGTELKEFLMGDMKEQSDYHYSINVSQGKVYRDKSQDHKYKCNQDENSDTLRVYCQYINMANNGIRLNMVAGLLIMIILMII